jgi:VanZ family protein
MPRKLILIAAWACALFIAYATLAPAGARPQLTSDEPVLVVFVERFGAYFLLGILFYFSYPHYLFRVCLLLFGTAIVLELLQLLIPGRDARLIDAIEKLAGGLTGITVGWLSAKFRLARKTALDRWVSH